MENDDLGADLLIGAAAIARDVLGSDSQKNRRKIYHLHERRSVPTFKLAGELAARRSRIRQRLAELEAAPLPDDNG